MADGPTHRRIGTLAGGACALLKGQGQRPEHLFLEAVGGALAGHFGGRLPDLLDPPTHPSHRGLAHGIVPVIVAGAVANHKLDSWQGRLRAEADRQADLRASASTPTPDSGQVVEILCRLAAGALPGFLGGYGSHIVLDASTPARLPLFW